MYVYILIRCVYNNIYVYERAGDWGNFFLNARTVQCDGFSSCGWRFQGKYILNV